MQDDAPLFCALHHVWKMDETIFEVWMSLLRTVPGSRLRLQVKETYYKAKEAYYKAKETCYKAKETYSVARHSW